MPMIMTTARAVVVAATHAVPGGVAGMRMLRRTLGERDRKPGCGTLLLVVQQRTARHTADFCQRQNPPLVILEETTVILEERPSVLFPQVMRGMACHVTRNVDVPRCTRTFRGVCRRRGVDGHR